MTERWDRFTEPARRALTLAETEAARLEHPDVAAEHILLGLLRVPDGAAAQALQAIGVGLDRQRRALEFLMLVGDAGAGAQPLGATARRVIERAVQEASEAPAVGTAHLLLGVLGEGDTLAVEALASQGVTRSRLDVALPAFAQQEARGARPAGGAPPEASRIPAAEAVAPPLGDWPIEVFEDHGRAVLALIGDYFRHIDETPVMATIAPGDLMALLDSPPPEQPEPFATLLADTREKIIPHLTHWNHPAFHAYFAISGSMPGILAETLAAAFNVNMMVWKSSPAAAALTRIVLRWIAELVGYPPESDAVFTNGASLGSFYALCAAREALGLDVREHGLLGRDLPRLRLYISDQTHSSLEKAAIALGLGLSNVVKIPSDAQYRMDPGALDAAIRADLAAGYRPLAVCATIGTTTAAAVDPLAPISAICREFGIWLHIDAAYGGFWGLVPEARAAIGDLAVGDSLIVNPHKTLYTQVEVSCLYCKRAGALSAAFSLVPEYLRTPAGEHIVNYMDYSLQLGHSFRALKLWWVLRSYGVSGIRARLADALTLTRGLEARVDADPDFQRLSSSPFGLVCLRAFPRDLQAAFPLATADEQARALAYLARLNDAILEQINTSGQAFLSHSVLREGYTLRVSIGNIRTEARHIDVLWRALQRAGGALDATLRPDGRLPA
jgi:aromatic-L-amino-acid/L-tryptophan decarboxylase